MARRRLIDPGVWQSGHFKRLNFRQRLLWVGVISLSDDEGKLKGEPAVIKAATFPFDNVSIKTVESDLRKLEEEGLLRRYEADGDKYILIVKWDKYQKPSHPTPSKIPDPPKISGVPPETLRNSSGISRSQVRSGKDREVEFKEGQAREGEVEGRKPTNEQTAGSASASAKASASPALEDPAGDKRSIPQELVSLYRKFYGHNPSEFASRLRKRGCSEEEIKKLQERLEDQGSEEGPGAP